MPFLPAGWVLPVLGTRGSKCHLSTPPASQQDPSGKLWHTKPSLLINIPQWFSTKLFLWKAGCSSGIGNWSKCKCRCELTLPKTVGVPAPTGGNTYRPSLSLLNMSEKKAITTPTPAHETTPTAPIGVSPGYKTSSAFFANLYDC